MFKKIFAAVISAVITVAVSAVSVFAADNLLFVKTEPVPKKAAEYAKDQWENNLNSPGNLVYLGLTKKEAKSAVLGNGFVVTHLGKADTEVYYYPILCDGRIVMFMMVHKDSGNGGYGFQMGKQDMEEKLNAVKTSPDDPAKLYDDYGIYLAATDDEVTVLKNLFKTDTDKEVAAVKKLHSEKNSKNEVINVYGSYKSGWQEIDGEKYYIKKDGTLVTKNTTIGGKRYKFSSDGKCLGVFTGWSKSKGNKYYYKKGVLQTGWITVKSKKYYAAKNGVIRTGWVAADGDIFYFDENGVWDGETYKFWNKVYKPETVGDFFLDFDYPDDTQYEINYNDGKYVSFDNAELIREILENAGKTKLVFDTVLSYDEEEQGLPYPSRNAVMIRSNPKQEESKKMPHLTFSRDDEGNTYLYVPLYGFGCILDDSTVYEKVLAGVPSSERKDEVYDFIDEE